MRRSRRKGHPGLEFGGSGEDSFVAVVVTKLTGALLFILLLTMVIMALLPKAVDLAGPSSAGSAPSQTERLTITTPEGLPEAIVGRPYAVALAAIGGRGPLRWSVDGDLPAGLTFDPATAQLRGTPKAGTPQPVTLVLRVADDADRAARTTQLAVFVPDRPLTLPSRWKPSLPPVPWRAWLEQGFGFLVLGLVYLVGMNTLDRLRRWSESSLADPDASEAEAEARLLQRRFARYRLAIRLATLGLAAALAAFLGWPR